MTERGPSFKLELETFKVERLRMGDGRRTECRWRTLALARTKVASEQYGRGKATTTGAWSPNNRGLLSGGVFILDRNRKPRLGISAGNVQHNSDRAAIP